MAAKRMQTKLKRPGRNDPCTCGSGKKYKRCCEGLELDASSKPARVSMSLLLQGAVSNHRGGRLTEAESQYREILQAIPNHSEALHGLGMIASARGRYDVATELIRRAIGASPSSPIYYNSLGFALRKLGRLDEAIDCLHNAISLAPSSFIAHKNLGNTLKQQGKLDDSIAALQRALELQPNDAALHCNLADVLMQQGKLDEAVASYRLAISFDPNYFPAHFNLGNVLQGQGHIDEAVAAFRKALSFQPNNAELHNNLGRALVEHGRLDEAIASYQKALALKPQLVAVHTNLGNALKDCGRLDEAIASYQNALSHKPDHSEAYGNLLYLYAYHGLIEPDEYLRCARGWENTCIPETDRRANRGWSIKYSPLVARRLRVGYVSGDYWGHAVSFFTEQLFTHHDKSRIELFAYSTSPYRDAVTSRLEALAEHWVPIAGLSDAAARARIQSDGIDVLVDLSGHTARNRLQIFAHRAAPVQLHYLGYFASTGLTEMDYWIGDDILTPPQTDRHFSEKVWRLPRVWVSYEGREDAPSPAWRPCSDGTIYVGSFNNLNKLTPETMELWAKLLHALPEGRLLLKASQLADVGIRGKLIDAMARHGISEDRIELRDRNSTPDWHSHMAYYDRLDIALDPVGGVGGGTTTCDALWMAVPVVTLMGDRMGSRMTASMLNAIGHPEWIAHTEADYIERVVALARDVRRRQKLRDSLRAEMARSPLCDARALAVNLEYAYFSMFERWLAKDTSGSVR